LYGNFKVLKSHEDALRATIKADRKQYPDPYIEEMIKVKEKEEEKAAK
jgi:hypothetical protein